MTQKTSDERATQYANTLHRQKGRMTVQNTQYTGADSYTA